MGYDRLVQMREPIHAKRADWKREKKQGMKTKLRPWEKQYVCNQNEDPSNNPGNSPSAMFRVHDLPNDDVVERRCSASRAN